MDKWAVATKRQAGRAQYEDAAAVMAGEFGWRSESRCVTPFLLKPITMLQDENRSFGCQMKSPRRIARAFHWLQMRLKAEGGEHAVDVRRAVVVIAAVAVDTAEGRGVARMHGASPVIAARRSTGIVRRCHALGFVVLVLGAVRLEVTLDFSHREQEDLVSRGRGGACLAAAQVVGHLRDGLHLGLEFARQKRPEVAGIEAAAEFGLLPAAGVRVRGVYSL